LRNYLNSVSKKNPKFNGRIFALGEALIDFISSDGVHFTFMPGGSVVNTALTLSNSGENVFLLSDLAEDEAANNLKIKLHKSGINTSYCAFNAELKTPIALAFLDDAKEAHYSFYRNYPLVVPQLDLPEMNSSDILIFGSSYAINPVFRNRVETLLEMSRRTGAMSYYDINIREKSTEKLKLLQPLYFKNMAEASIVKGSLDDFSRLLDMDTPPEIYNKIKSYCKNIIITNGSKEVSLCTPNYIKTYQVPAISVVSAIGAGDNFNAGFIFGLKKYNSDSVLNEIELNWDAAILSGISFAAAACKTIHSHLSKQNLNKLFTEKNNNL